MEQLSRMIFDHPAKNISCNKQMSIFFYTFEIIRYPFSIDTNIKMPTCPQMFVHIFQTSNAANVASLDDISSKLDNVKPFNFIAPKDTGFENLKTWTSLLVKTL